LLASSFIFLALVKHLLYEHPFLQLLYKLLANASIRFSLMISAWGNSLIKLSEVLPKISLAVKHFIYSGNELAIICLNLFFDLTNDSVKCF